jgi:hypothetical protein
MWQMNDYEVYSRGKHCETELALTAVLSRAIDRFLFPDSSVGGCFHQMPTRKRSSNPESADVYVLSYHNHLPSVPILVGDFKLINQKVARFETDGYAHTLLEVCYNGPSYPLLLGLPCTRSAIQLVLYFACQGHLHKIPLAEATISTTDAQHNLKKMLCAMYAGVHCLINQSIFCNETMQIECCDGEHEGLHRDVNYQCNLSYNVIYCIKKSIVLKYYESPSKLNINPHEKLMMELPGYEDLHIEREDLTSEVFRIKMKYIKQRHPHVQCSFFQAVQLLRIIKVVHDMNYVHSDIRECNILFSCDSRAVYLIDFDLCDYEDTRYPSVYNHGGIDERHKDAVASHKRKKCHDRYSLSVVLGKVCPVLSTENLNLVKSNTPLDEVIVKFEESFLLNNIIDCFKSVQL